MSRPRSEDTVEAIRIAKAVIEAAKKNKKKLTDQQVNKKVGEFFLARHGHTPRPLKPHFIAEARGEKPLLPIRAPKKKNLVTVDTREFVGIPPALVGILKELRTQMQKESVLSITFDDKGALQLTVMKVDHINVKLP